MRNVKQIQNEIVKLRKILKLKSSTDAQKDMAWVVMLSLQWALSEDKMPIGPANLCRPNIFKWDYKL